MDTLGFREIVAHFLYCGYLIWSWGSFLLRNISDVFQRGVRVCLRKLGYAFRAGWHRGYVLNFSAVLSLFSRSLFPPTTLSFLVPPTTLSLHRSSGLLYIPWFHFEKWLRCSRRYCFAISRNVLVSLLPNFFPHHPLMKKVSRVCPPFSPTLFLCCFRISSYSVE